MGEYLKMENQDLKLSILSLVIQRNSGGVAISEIVKEAEKCYNFVSSDISNDDIIVKLKEDMGKLKKELLKYDVFCA